MNRFRRITVIIITALIALAMFSSAAFIAAESDHDCTGEDCAVCCAISACVNAFKTFFVIRAALKICGDVYSPATPVSLKTKLLN